MKGIISILEVVLTGTILILAFLHFFPQYSFESKWDKTLLEIKVKDTINTIERLDKTYELATDTNAFEEFMGNLFSPESVGGALVYWKQTEGLTGYTEDMKVPHFSKGHIESIVDVVNIGGTVDVYKFSLGLGYPF